MMNRRVICLLTLLALCALSAGTPSAQTDPPSEYAVKAAFLYHFASFMEWPHQVFHYDDSPITIGVLGEDPFGPALAKIVAGRMAQGRLFEIRHFKNVDEIGVCHVLFISSSEQARMSAILAALKQPGLLTVADVDGFAQMGGVIGFFAEGRKLRFEINVGAAHAAGIKISSKLLSLARVVGDAPKEEQK